MAFAPAVGGAEDRAEVRADFRAELGARTPVRGAFDFAAAEGRAPSRALAWEYFRRNRVQEAAWSLRRAGDREGARDLVDRLKAYLQSAPIVRRRSLGAATSQAERVWFASGISAVFKPGLPELVYSHYRREVLAWALDDLLELDLVPVTVVRALDGRAGSLQYFVEDATAGERAPSYQPEAPAHRYAAGYEGMWLLDYLLQNRDRHGWNYLFRPGRHLVAIDNSMAYGPDDDFWQNHSGIPPVLHPFRTELLPGGDRVAALERLTAKRIGDAAFGVVPPELVAHALLRRDQVVAWSQGCSAELAAAGSMEIGEASYGENCGAAAGNVTDAVAHACAGRRSCEYRIDPDRLGDPVYGCAKEFRLRWRCGGEGGWRTLTLAREASGRSFVIACP